MHAKVKTETWNWYIERKKQVSYSWHLSWSTGTLSPDNPQFSWLVSTSKQVSL